MNPQKEDNTALHTEAVRHFIGLKKMYEGQREQVEGEWKECWDFYYNTAGISKVFTGFSNIRVPIISAKVNHVLGRIESILFNITRIGRYEPNNTSTVPKLVVEAMNRYVFEKQLKDIQFRSNYHLFNLQKVVLGSSVAKISQEYDTSDISYTGEDSRSIATKDNTYFKPIILNEFYSDATRQCIHESAACIHSTLISIDELKKNEKRTVMQTVVITLEDGTIIEETIEQEVGVYENVDLVDPSYGVTEEMEAYLMGLGSTEATVASYSSAVTDSKKTGMVRVDECWGKFDIDGSGNAVECLAVIANGAIILRLEKSPFNHKRYKRPFVFGVYRRKLGVLYGESLVYKSIPLVKELNAARSQSSDSRLFSIFPMIYVNSSGMTGDWDGQWKPMGIIQGTNQTPPVIPIVNPSLGHVSGFDINLILKDLDDLWSISPIQQGISDTRLLPGTASATYALLAQNDFVLDNIISEAIESELLPFFEQLLERNFSFKTPSDILTMLTPEELQGFNTEELPDMRGLVFDSTINICGNTQLSQEQNNRQGYERLLQLSQQIPNLARRIDYPALTNKLLASYGILDDSKEIMLPESNVQAVIAEEQAQGQMQAADMQAQIQELVTQNQALQQKIANKPVEDLQIHAMKSQMDLQAAHTKMQMETEERTKQRMAEVEIETQSGKRVN